MKVEIINKEELLNMVKNHGEFACVCYGTPDKYAEKVGKSCQESGHMSGSRCEYIKFRIYDIDRGTAETGRQIFLFGCQNELRLRGSS